MLKSDKIQISTQQTVFPVIFAMSGAHLCNDLLQSLIPSMYPILKESYRLSFSEIGWITFAFQITASLFSPL